MPGEVLPATEQSGASPPGGWRVGLGGAALARVGTGSVGSAAVVALVLLTGAATAVDPRLGALVAVVSVAAWLAADATRAASVFVAGLAVILVGYAVLDRGFAHIGSDPVYVGEIVLGAGVVAIAARADRLRARPIPILLGAFIAWGVARTVPYLSTYGTDALRDGVTYGYALFAFAVMACITDERIQGVIAAYGRLLPFLLAWIPIGLVVTYVVSSGAGFLGSGVPLLDDKPGDAAVHLAGIAAFLLLGLDEGRSAWGFARDTALWAVWLVGAAVAAILNRGGMLALGAVAVVVLVTRPARRWANLAVTAAAILAVLLVVDPEVSVGAGTRTISVSSVVANVTSVLFTSTDPALQGTKDFRLQWWGTIVGYTIDGPYFWTGKGFGINLADADGFQVTADHSLRAPHNVHVEVLARMGVPGLVLWILLQAAFAIALLRAALAARRLGFDRWTARFVWILVYWLAMIVNMSFDPYLDGPQGGIWFWAVFGFGLVLLESWRRTEAEVGARTRLIAAAADG